MIVPFVAPNKQLVEEQLFGVELATKFSEQRVSGPFSRDYQRRFEVIHPRKKDYRPRYNAWAPVLFWSSAVAIGGAWYLIARLIRFAGEWWMLR